jgi:hypothetical protein
MLSPQEFHITFSHKAIDYDINLVKNGNSDHLVTINGVVYAVLGDKEKLKAASEILNSVSLDSISNVEDLNGRLSLRSDISFPQIKKTDEISKETFKSTTISSQTPSIVEETKERQSQTEMSQLIYLVKNIRSEDDIKVVCLKCLALHNNHPGLALDYLKEVFRLAGRGPVSAKITDKLIQEASNRNVDEIRAFGRKRTVEVVSFLKTLPQTKKGAIDLTRMKKIGQGGTQDVYALQGAPSLFVIKVIRASLKMKDDERLEKYMVDKAAYQALHDAFGNHCTVEQLLLRNIDDGTSTKEALISVAAFEEGYTNKSKIGLNAPDFEWDSTSIVKNLNTYEKFLKSLFITEAESDFDLKLLKENLSNPGFVRMVGLIERDPGFRDALKVFLSEFKDYFIKTGQYLDIAGENNIIFFQTNNEWVFRLGTVIKKETAQKFSEALEKIRVGANAPEEQDYDNMTYYCFHWTKTLNMLGMMVGMGKIIDDDNVKTIASLWIELEKTGWMMGTPSDPIQVLNVLETLEKYPAEELLEKLQALKVNPERNADILVGFLSKLAPEKKLVLALYLHSLLPKAGDPKPDYKFCPIRYKIGMDLKVNKDSKELALACLKDVMLDPQAPHDEVQKAIEELS